MQKQLLVTLASLLVLLLVAACAPQAAPATAPAAPAPAAPAPVPAAVSSPKVTKEAWQVKWDALVEGAKKEGKVVIYATPGGEFRRVFQQAFKDRFGTDAEFVIGSSAAVGARAMAERRVGLHLGDLLIGAGTQVISLLKPAGFAQRIEVGDVLILPEFSDPKLWLGGRLSWQDAEHTTLAFCRYEIHPAARNTELVKEGEFQSYNDLLNPKWKGKITIADPAQGGVALKALVMVGRYTMGWDWVRALVKQEPIIIDNARLQVEWLARGKYAVSYGLRSDMLYEFQTNMGMPVDTVYMREGGWLGAGSGNIGLLKDSPHPNAARLFINWLLTKEGQTIFTGTTGYPSARLDVSDKGASFPRAASDSKAPDGGSEEAILQQNEDSKIVKEILLPLLLSK